MKLLRQERRVNGVAEGSHGLTVDGVVNAALALAGADEACLEQQAHVARDGSGRQPHFPGKLLAVGRLTRAAAQQLELAPVRDEFEQTADAIVRHLQAVNAEILVQQHAEVDLTAVAARQLVMSPPATRLRLI